MSKKTHVHHKHHKQSSQEGYISSELKQAMSRNEKIIMGALIGGILIFLVIAILLLFRQKDEGADITVPPAISGGTEEKVVLTPYPTIPPIENMTVVVNNRRFNPSSFSIPRGGTVDFLNMGTEPITIEGADGQSSMLNLGTIQPTEINGVTFDTPGTYRFRTSQNPQQIGVITIQ